jgi:hypothetical protein
VQGELSPGGQRVEKLEYKDFELQIGPQAGEGYRLHVLRSPAGEGEGHLVLPAEIADLAAASYRHPAETGAALYKDLFSGEIADLFNQSLSEAAGRNGGRGLRLRLRIHPRTPALHQVPWELLHRSLTGDFLALSRLTPVVRSLDVARSAAVPPFTAPLRILFVLSQDALLNLGAELAALKKVLAKNPAIAFEELIDPQDPQALRALLLRQTFHVIHYMGHGNFDPQSGEGSLSWGGLDHKWDLGGQDLAVKLQDVSSLRLVVLNACETAKSGGTPGGNPFTGVATALVQAGIPAVAAMQSPIGDAHAIAFSSAFYDRLAHGRPLEEAVTEGRQAIHSQNPKGVDWAIPVIFMRTAPKKGLFAAEEATAGPTIAMPVTRKAWDRRRLAAWAAVVLLAASQGGTLFYRQTVETAITQEAHEPLPKYRPLPLKPRGKSVKPSSTSAPAQPTSRTVTVGAIRFNISADPRVADVFARELKIAAAALATMGFVAQTVSVRVSPPSLSSSADGKLCRLSASFHLSGKGSFPIPSIPRSQGDETTACQVAAQALAEAVADQVAANL